MQVEMRAYWMPLGLLLGRVGQRLRLVNQHDGDAITEGKEKRTGSTGNAVLGGIEFYRPGTLRTGEDFQEFFFDHLHFLGCFALPLLFFCFCRQGEQMREDFVPSSFSLTLWLTLYRTEAGW